MTFTAGGPTRLTLTREGDAVNANVILELILILVRIFAAGQIG